MTWKKDSSSLRDPRARRRRRHPHRHPHRRPRSRRPSCSAQWHSRHGFRQAPPSSKRAWRFCCIASPGTTCVSPGGLRWLAKLKWNCYRAGAVAPGTPQTVARPRCRCPAACGRPYQERSASGGRGVTGTAPIGSRRRSRCRSIGSCRHGQLRLVTGMGPASAGVQRSRGFRVPTHQVARMGVSVDRGRTSAAQARRWLEASETSD